MQSISWFGHQLTESGSIDMLCGGYSLNPHPQWSANFYNVMQVLPVSGIPSIHRIFISPNRCLRSSKQNTEYGPSPSASSWGKLFSYQLAARTKSVSWLVICG